MAELTGAVIALDIATRTGWAVYRPSDLAPTWGAKLFRPAFKGDYGGPALRLLRFVRSMIAEHDARYVVFESPIMVPGRDTLHVARMLYGLALAAEMAALTEITRSGKIVDHREFGRGEVLKSVLGAKPKGRPAQKAAVIRACQMRGWDVGSDDDAADALALLEHALGTWRVTVPWAHTELEAAAMRRAGVR